MSVVGRRQNVRLASEALLVPTGNNCDLCLRGLRPVAATDEVAFVACGNSDFSPDPSARRVLVSSDALIAIQKSASSRAVTIETGPRSRL